MSIQSIYQYIVGRMTIINIVVFYFLSFFLLLYWYKDSHKLWPTICSSVKNVYKKVSNLIILTVLTELWLDSQQLFKQIIFSISNKKNYYQPTFFSKISLIDREFFCFNINGLRIMNSVFSTYHKIWSVFYSVLNK